MNDQGTAQFVLDARSQILEIPCSKAIRKQTGPKKNAYIDPNKEGEAGGNQCVRKRRCGVGRGNGYETGCEIEDTTTTGPESSHLHETGQGRGAENQGDSAFAGKHWGSFRGPTASFC